MSSSAHQPAGAGASTSSSDAGAVGAPPRPIGAIRRVIAVGDELPERLRGPLDEVAPQATLTPVPSFLAAMGELARQSADVVIGPAHGLRGMTESAARCLRQLAPQVRLVVVRSPQRSDTEIAESAARAGFDAVLAGPVDPEKLVRALTGSPATQTAPPAPGASAPAGETAAPPEPTAPADEASTRDRPAPTEPASSPEVTANATTDVNATGADEADASATAASPPVDDEDLGDVDLVEAILAGREHLRPLALRLLAARSGIRGVTWAPPHATLPDDHAWVEVTHRGQRFGLLHAPPPARREALAGWAAWLAHWLALDHHVAELESLAMKDELTGVWNRRYFNRFLQRILDQAVRDRSQVTLLVFDIDDFKLYNDRYGHAAGDEILRETARLMQSFVREHDVVARIGGDEFAVIFWDAGMKRRPDSHHPDSVKKAAHRFQKAICAHRFPKLLNEAPGTLTISGGLASFPWDGRTPEELLERADAMALQSKRQGKNVITFGPGALRVCDHNTAPPAD